MLYHHGIAVDVRHGKSLLHLIEGPLKSLGAAASDELRRAAAARFTGELHLKADLRFQFLQQDGRRPTLFLRSLGLAGTRPAGTRMRSWNCVLIEPLCFSARIPGGQ